MGGAYNTILLHLKIMIRTVLPMFCSLRASRWICAGTVLQQNDCLLKHLSIKLKKSVKIANFSHIINLSNYQRPDPKKIIILETDILKLVMKILLLHYHKRWEDFLNCTSYFLVSCFRTLQQQANITVRRLI